MIILPGSGSGPMGANPSSHLGILHSQTMLVANSTVCACMLKDTGMIGGVQINYHSFATLVSREIQYSKRLTISPPSGTGNQAC